MSLYFVRFLRVFYFFIFLSGASAFFSPALSDQQESDQIKELFPACLIMPGSSGNAVLVEKISQTLFLYLSEGGKFYKKLEFPCSTGEVSGPKSLEGDKKTPEGIYFLEKEYDDRYLSAIYGKKAFTTNYPNYMDKMAGRNGSAIWIHGTNKQLKPMDSNGCVAMNNKDILELEQYIVLNETPLIIVENIEYADADEINAEGLKINHFMSRWIDAMDGSQYNNVLSFYSVDYKPGLDWWMDWVRLRKDIKKNYDGISLAYDCAGIFGSKDYFVVFVVIKNCFTQNCFPLGQKKLFITKKMTEYKIAGEFW